MNQWVHIACVREGDVITMYVDGVDADHDSIYDDIAETSMEDFTVGGLSSSYYTGFGYLDELRVLVGECLQRTPGISYHTIIRSVLYGRYIAQV